MKIKQLLVLWACTAFAFANLPAQTPTSLTNSQGQEITVSTPVDFQVSPPVRDWAPLERNQLDKEVHGPRRVHRALKNSIALPDGIDPALQTTRATRIAGPPIESWKGLDGGTPPDPSGAAGPNHYVQAVNVSYAVYDKSGTMQAGPFSLASLWPGTIDEGDPIVMYDRHADRWFISQFQDQPARMLLAVSQTADPTGSYYTYSYQMSDFPDYPKFSIWWDGYYMTANASQTTVVFERDEMLAGNPNARMVALNTVNTANLSFVSLLPSDADGALPPNGTPSYFFHFEDDGFGAPSDRIIINEMTVDWNNVGNTQVTQTQVLNPSPFDSDLSPGITQGGSSSVLDPVAEVFYYRAPYMRWTNHNSVVLCHVVDIDGNNTAGMRWYELRQPGTGLWNIHQQGTFAPDSENRWMGSIAMDNQGNIGMGYSIASSFSNNSPGLRYTGRLAADPAGMMTVAEETAIAGGAGINEFRYGDYSQLTLDPDGQTFWFTGEYVDGSGNSTTRIFSFQIGIAAGLESNPYYRNLEMKVFRQADQFEVSVSGLYTQDQIQLDVISLSGKVLYHTPLLPISSSINHTVNMDAIASGIYFIRVGNEHFQTVERIVITD